MFTVIDDGRQTLFWVDSWLNGDSINDIAPHLSQSVPPRTWRSQTVRDAMTDRQWVHSIRGGAIASRHRWILDVMRLPGECRAQRSARSDSVVLDTWRQVLSEICVCHSALRIDPILGSLLDLENMGALWVKIFLWLAFRWRHWTADRRACHGLDARALCYLCDQKPETIDHIIAECPFTREVWCRILQALGSQLPQTLDTITTAWRRLRAGWNRQQKAGIDLLFALVSWQIWKERNACVFRETSSTVSELLAVIKAEAERWVLAGANGLGCLVTG
jgi:hypothetical protein